MDVIKDPYVLFLEAVQKVRRDIGENMTGFIMNFAAKKIDHPDGAKFPGIPDDQLLFSWAIGGPQAVVNQACLEMAVNYLERSLQMNQGDLYLTTEKMKVMMLENLAQRSQQRRS